MPPLKIVCHRNNPPAGGWAGLGLGLLCLVVGRRSPAASSQAFWLQACAGMFGLIGAWILLWAPKRTTIVDADKNQVFLEDRDRFRTRNRVIPFALIAEVAVQEWEDPDPDLRPFKSIHSWLVLRLWTGEEIEITDHQRGALAFDGLESAISSRLFR